MKSVPRPRTNDVLAGLAVAAAYMVAGKVGLSLASVNKSATAVWPPTGIALAAFLALGYRVWPGVMLGAFLVNLTTAGTVATSLGIAVGNTLEGALGCYLVRRFAGGPRVFDQPSTIFAFAGLAGLLATAVSATVGTSILLLGGLAGWHESGAIWLTWWLGDSAGALTVAPLVLLWWMDHALPWGAKSWVELGGLLLALLIAATIVFTSWSPFHAKLYPIQYLCLPPLLWSAFRFRQRECATALAFLSAIAIHGTLHGNGPFAGRPMNESLLLLQGFMAVLSITVLATAAAVVGRRRVEISVRQLNEELERRVVERTEQLWRSNEELRSQILKRARARKKLERSEARLREAERAEEDNRLKDEFLATLSHELRTPLNAIMGWANILKQGGIDKATTARAVETIDRNVRIQSHLISDILDISRMTSGRLELRFQSIPLVPAIESALDTMRPMAQLKRVELRPELEPLPDSIRADPDRLQQIVWNLLSNAIKFAPEGGGVVIRLTREHSMATLLVEDDGPGIDPEFLPYVFERFRQKDSTGTRRHGGLGLGLAIVRHLVELHGGTVSASNRPGGRGAVFEVRLPLLTAPEPQPAAAAGPEEGQLPGGGNHARPLRGIRILLVEDDQDSRELIAMYLEGRGATVAAASSAQEALAAFEPGRFDLVVSDIAMPGKSGYDLIRELRTLPPDIGGRVPAVALTAYAAPEDVKKALDAGFDAHMAKPVEMDDLAVTLLDLLAPREP